MLQEPGVSTGLMGHLAHMKTLTRDKEDKRLRRFQDGKRKKK